MARYDLAVVGGEVVIPYVGTIRADIGVKNGRIAAIQDEIASSEADKVVDARGKAVFPGGVDSHFHIGIYRPIAVDAESETESSLVGGVTSVISYFRTGQHYLDKTGPYKEIFPEVLQATAGHAYADYGFHIAIMTNDQLDEVEWLVQQGVGSFKYYMFYKGLNLTASSTAGSSYTMSDEYDLGHLYKMMRSVKEMSVKYGKHGRISICLHCEQAELIRVFIEEVKKTNLTGLAAYSAGRPPLTERLAIKEAGVLLEATECPVNLLHLSSEVAFETADEFRRLNPALDVQLETTLHHLCLNHDNAANGRSGQDGKVNPPIRLARDNEALWNAVLQGRINTVVSDHACCMEEEKEGELWGALPGFGGTAILYPVLISDGYHKRGLPLHRVAELASANPARNFGLMPRKGTIQVGADADLAVVDMNLEQKITPDLLHSAEDFTPFEGYPVKGWPVVTIRRGEILMENGKVVGGKNGEFLKRPAGLHA